MQSNNSIIQMTAPNPLSYQIYTDNNGQPGQQIQPDAASYYSHAQLTTAMQHGKSLVPDESIVSVSTGQNMSNGSITPPPSAANASTPVQISCNDQNGNAVTIQPHQLQQMGVPQHQQLLTVQPMSAVGAMQSGNSGVIIQQQGQNGQQGSSLHQLPEH